MTKLGPGFRYRSLWSPDGKKVVFVDQAMRINLCDVATGAVTPDRQGAVHVRGRRSRASARAGRPTAAGSPTPATLENRQQRDLPLRHAGAASSTRSPRASTTTAARLRPGRASTCTSCPTALRAVLRRSRQHLDLRQHHPTRRRSPLRRDVASPLAPRNDVEEQEGREEGRGRRKEAKKKDEGRRSREGREEGREACQAEAGRDRSRRLRAARRRPPAEGRQLRATRRGGGQGAVPAAARARAPPTTEKSPIVLLRPRGARGEDGPCRRRRLRARGRTARSCWSRKKATTRSSRSSPTRRWKRSSRPPSSR